MQIMKNLKDRTSKSIPDHQENHIVGAGILCKGKCSSEDNCIINKVIDSGSSISLIRSHIVETSDRQPFKKYVFISGINGSKLNIEAVANITVSLVDYNKSKKQVSYVVDDHTMSSKYLLGRGFIKGMEIAFGEAGMMITNIRHEISNDKDFLDNLGLINYDFGDDFELNVGDFQFIYKC